MRRARPLRVVVVARAVLPLHGFGGLERSVRDLVRHLAASDVEVTLIVPPPSRVFRQTGVDPFASPRIHLTHVNYVTFGFANRRGTTILDRSTAYLVYGERAGRLAGALARNGGADIVHGFGASVLGYARMGAGKAAPLVLNPQGLEEFGATAETQPLFKKIGYAPLRWAVRRCARAADCILATDVSLEATVARHLRPQAGQMRTVPNGIDLAEVVATAGPAEGGIMRQRHGIGAHEFVILSVGRLEQNKGFADLALALGEAQRDGTLSSTQTPWRWVIAGMGPERQALEDAANRAGIADRTVFAGRMPDADLHAWYEAASLFAHPTRYEGSSLVTLEAMAHRRAVVATRAGGLPDKIKPGVNGWLVEPGDIKALARAIGEAASAGPRLTAMGAEGRRIVETGFAWTALVKRQIEIYEDLLSARAGSRVTVSP
ncbi:MAG TPA: glycosyltransferase family 4 protein [Vicinamibacterales bacterium]|nr:glycosyltransferase family 4 protein [Vicinamibacterales bacterium]